MAKRVGGSGGVNKSGNTASRGDDLKDQTYKFLDNLFSSLDPKGRRSDLSLRSLEGKRRFDWTKVTSF